MFSPMHSRQRFLAPEVVQTSAMDCGPASLKCLLEGFNIPVGYGRLREACQTDVDGSSIDVIEVVANQLGIEAEQVMLPVDHLFLSETAALPAMVVVRLSDGLTHFVVVWRRHGRWLQVMDPAIGRRWISCKRFTDEIFRHQLAVPAAHWREWAASNEFLAPLRRGLSLLGATATRINQIVDRALAAPGWLQLAALDSSIRMITAIIQAGGLKPGQRAVNLLDALTDRASHDPAGIWRTIPASYWSVLPGNSGTDGEERLLLCGAVLLRIKGPRDSASTEEEAPLSPELAAALAEKPSHPGMVLLRMLRNDGLLTPLALAGASAIAMGGILVEALLFRGLFDIAWELNLANQRLAAVLGLMAFIGILLLMEIPIAVESLRIGRHFEVRMRMALLRKLPKLNDRYFQSRPISDMAERSHSIHLIRQISGLGIQTTQALWDLLFTLTGIALIDAASIPLALLIAILSLGLPLATQPLLNERDLRVRSHAGALHNFYLDALLGLVPVRTHCAEQAIRREHEGLLVEWARAGRSLVRISVLTDGLQSLACTGLAGLLLLDNFRRIGATGGVLLLVYWTLKLPAIGHKLSTLTHQYPAQRNILLRLLEPLSTPEDIHAPAENAASPSCQTKSSRGLYSGLSEHTDKSGGVSIIIEGGSVLASGHTILEDIDLSIASGEHVAIVGTSGAGKSSLLGLLLGWHRLAGGNLQIDGAALRGSELEGLRQKTAWVDPAIQIWNRPFLDNLRYSSGHTAYTEVGQTIDSADLRGILQKLPSGMQTRLGEGGALLSGGEGQRVRLGRAMMQDEIRLALLDEPFRGLDRSQRSKLLANARRGWYHATLLCVTHDVGETLSFNRVLVVEAGRIIEDGSPQTLASSNSRYRDLLNAEISIRQGIWQADGWRRINIRDGRVQAFEMGNEK